MADIRNCKNCGRIFNYMGKPICPDCIKEDDEDFKKVRDYLYKYPGTSMSKVSEELEVSMQKIKRYLREGRLEIVGDDPNMILSCEVCGRSIKSGRFCDMCVGGLTRDLEKTAAEISEDLSSTSSEIENNELKYLEKK